MPLGILFRGQKLPGFGMLQIVRVGIFNDQNQGILFHSHTNLNPPVLFRAGSGSLDGVIQSVSQHNAQITLINGELFRKAKIGAGGNEPSYSFYEFFPEDMHLLKKGKNRISIKLLPAKAEGTFVKFSVLKTED